MSWIEDLHKQLKTKRRVDEQVACIPTGIDVLDRYVIGYGGIPVRRITELYGGEGSGKSSLALQIIANAQRMGAGVCFLETEHTVDWVRATTVFGVDRSDLYFDHPETIEDVLTTMDKFLQLSEVPHPRLVVWDSLAATPTAAELESGLHGSEAIGIRARMLSRACRILSLYADTYNAAILIINQTRVSLSGFGVGTTTPGGNAMKFHASLRIEIMGGTAVKQGEEHIGREVTMMARKNKLGPPSRKARVRLLFDTGWDNVWTTVRFGKDKKLIGARAHYNEETANEVWEKYELR